MWVHSCSRNACHIHMHQQEAGGPEKWAIQITKIKQGKWIIAASGDADRECFILADVFIGENGLNTFEDVVKMYHSDAAFRKIVENARKLLQKKCDADFKPREANLLI